MNPNPFELSKSEITNLLESAAHPFPELQEAMSNVTAFRDSKLVQDVLVQSENLVPQITSIPAIYYSSYRKFRAVGSRSPYGDPHDRRREYLSLAAFRVMLGDTSLSPLVEDYLWSICEESTWVAPWHEGRSIDINAGDTAWLLAESITWLEKQLNEEVRHRVRCEIERRIFEPYLARLFDCRWYQAPENWNSVCNSQVGMTFLLLERDRGRLGAAMRTVLEGLQIYLGRAFAEDGSCNEGIGYFHYGMFHFTAFAEMLRACTKDSVDLLRSDRVSQIASFPGKMQLSPGYFATFSDCSEQLTVHPGFIERLAERSAAPTLLALNSLPTKIDWYGLSYLLRHILWQTGVQSVTADPGDALFPSGGIVRLTSPATTSGLVVVVKGGHNAENHNHNDVGSVIVHKDGEDFITDPGLGLYDQAYFSSTRYENIFTNSYGHSVPRIGSSLQGTGGNFFGQILGVNNDENEKSVRLELSRAYPLPELISLIRTISLPAASGLNVVFLEDEFRYSEVPQEAEEAFVTWLDVELKEAFAVIHGNKHRLIFTVQEPQGTSIQVEQLEEASKQNNKKRILKRISFKLPQVKFMNALIRMEVLPR